MKARDRDEMLISEADAVHHRLKGAELEALDEGRELVTAGSLLTDQIRSLLSVAVVRCEMSPRRGSHTTRIPNHNNCRHCAYGRCSCPSSHTE